MDTSRSSRPRRLRRLGTALLGALTLAGSLTLAPTPASAAADPGWLPWVGPSLEDLDVWVRAFGTAGTTMYAGTEGDGVFRSTNGGTTWSAYSTDLPTDSDSIRDIEASLSDVLLATNGGVWRSTGGAWAPLGQGEGANKLNLPTQSLYKAGGVLFAGVVGGVYKSADNGNTWTNSSTGLPIGTTVWSIDGYSYLPGYLFAATSSGAYVTLNNGGSWSPVTNGLPTGTNILRILADPLAAGTWYAITSGEGVYRTETFGLLWEPVNDDLPTEQVRSILLLPIDSSSALVIGTNDGVFTSFDKGDTWNSISNDGLDGHTSIWALSTTPVPLALVAGAQGGGVRYRLMAPPVNLAIPAITPNAGLNVGEQVTTSNGTWEGTDEITFTYQWQRCSTASTASCSDIDGENQQSYTLTSTDQGKYLRSRVTAHNPVDLPASLTTAASNLVGTVAAAPGSLPGATIRQNPTIGVPAGPDFSTGTVFPGETLTATPNTWNPAATSFAYQWYRCSTVNEASCSPVGGFGGNTHVLTDADADHFMRVIARGRTQRQRHLRLLRGQPADPPPPGHERHEARDHGPRLAGPDTGPLDRLVQRPDRACVHDMAGLPGHDGHRLLDGQGGSARRPGINTLTLDNGHLGKYLRVTVEVDVNGAESPQPITVASAFTAKVTAAPAKVSNSKEPTIIGTPAPGVVLSVTKGTWGGAPTLSRRWMRCNADMSGCTSIAGATGATYAVKAADVGKRIVVRVTGVNAWALPVTVQTAPTKVATATLKPVYETGGSVTGKRRVGRTLTANKGVWSASPAATFTYKWFRNGNPISGATGKSYTLKAADAGTTITCVVQGEERRRDDPEDAEGRDDRSLTGVTRSPGSDPPGSRPTEGRRGCHHRGWWRPGAPRRVCAPAGVPRWRPLRRARRCCASCAAAPGSPRRTRPRRSRLIRAAPCTIIAIASGSGTRHATPSMKVSADSVLTADPAANDSAVALARSATTPTISVSRPSRSRAVIRPADPRAETDRHVHRVEVPACGGHRLEELEGIGGHAPDEVEVERRDHLEAPLVGQRSGVLPGGLEVVARTRSGRHPRRASRRSCPDCCRAARRS